MRCARKYTKIKTYGIRLIECYTTKNGKYFMLSAYVYCLAYITNKIESVLDQQK